VFQLDPDGKFPHRHPPRDGFRRQLWLPACLAAGIDPPIRLHDLRPSHASWLLAGGADLQVVTCWQLDITWAELQVLIDSGQVIASHDLAMPG